MSELKHGLAFGTPKFYIAPYDKTNHALVNLSYNCDVKSGLQVVVTTHINKSLVYFLVRRKLNVTFGCSEC